MMMKKTEIEFLEAMKVWVALEPHEAWRAFRAEFDQNALPGRTAGDREATFKTKLAEYSEFPALLVRDTRNARVAEFKRDLGVAYMRVTCVTEDEVADWFNELGAVANSDRNVPSALEMLVEKDPGSAAKLTSRAKVLWPGLFEENPE